MNPSGQLMKIILWHGYLLTGTGSNLYTKNVARVWRKQGHDVLLICQENHPEALDFVDSFGEFSADNTSFSTSPHDAEAAPGTCTIVRPSIGEILPVYVYDEYEGFVAKRFIDLTDAELATYTDRNVVALGTAIREFRPDVITTGHEVMGPFIAYRACRATQTTYSVKLHGSALEYAVKAQPERYLEYARTGLNGARAITGGSEYMLRETGSVVAGWEDKAAVVNPGCDIELFHLAESGPAGPPRIIYVGKLIAAKGVHHLMAALGLLETHDVSVDIIGFGSFEDALKDLWDALRNRDRERALAIADRGEGTSLPHLRSALESAGDDFWERIAATRLGFLGRLEHGPISRALPSYDLLIAPSVVPEAFGMVAAEAAACGVLPVVPDHSGIGEAGRAIEDAIEAPGALRFDPESPVRSLADRIDALLAMNRPERRRMGLAAAALARERWSWETVANKLLNHAMGGSD